MNRISKKPLLAIAAAALALMAAACNTVEGAGKDVKAAGAAVEDTAQRREELIFFSISRSLSWTRRSHPAPGSSVCADVGGGPDFGATFESGTRLFGRDIARRILRRSLDQLLVDLHGRRGFWNGERNRVTLATLAADCFLAVKLAGKGDHQATAKAC